MSLIIVSEASVLYCVKLLYMAEGCQSSCCDIHDYQTGKKERGRRNLRKVKKEKKGNMQKNHQKKTVLK